jgi:hypothetical protein
VALALAPVYLVERASYFACKRALLRFLGAWSSVEGRAAPLASFERYKAKARNARRRAGP